MSDSDEALWQGVEQKPADKLDGTNSDLFKDIVLSVFIPEADHVVFKACDARVGDGHPVSIACDVLEDMLRLLNGFPDTDDPIVFVELSFELLIWKINLQLPLAYGAFEVVHELTPKDH